MRGRVAAGSAPARIVASIMKQPFRIALLGAALLAAGCVSMPSGPRVMALPGSAKSFDQFRADDGECRQFASAQVGGATPENAVTDSGVRSAVTGTAIGAAAGAAMSGSSGAAVGAGAGLLIGALAGSGYANASGYDLQRRYDNGYVQCMYSKGHKVPAQGRFTSAPAPRPAAASVPPPPPGAAPPPPYSASPRPPLGTPPPPPRGSPPPPPPA